VVDHQFAPDIVGRQLGLRCADGRDELVLVDLFSGCGGFSLGAHQAGFRVAAAFDNDATLTSSFPNNFPDTRLVQTDIADLDSETLVAAAGGRIDGIFGGPPCQGFSDIGRRRADDPRRQLIGNFFRLVAAVEPTFFVMENVRGLAYSNARGVLDDALLLVRDRYEILGPQIWDASQFGAATKRRRLFVIGVHKDRGEAIVPEDVEIFRLPPATVRTAITDLKGAVPMVKEEEFDVWRITRLGRPHKYARALRAIDGRFTGHRMTKHSPAVIRRFEMVAQGAFDTVGRHPRLDWTKQCPTLRAGTGADRGSYQSVRPIHPDEPRVITVREAARLQGFPDQHRFHPTIWHSFRMIGNSVSPIMANAIFTAIASKFETVKPYAIAAE